MSYLRLAAAQLFGKALRVGDRVFQVILRVRIFVNAHGYDPSCPCALEAVSAGQQQISVFTFDVVFVEGIGRQPIGTGNQRDLFFERGRSLSFERVTMPDLDERPIAEQTHIASTASLRMFRVGG